MTGPRHGLFWRLFGAGALIALIATGAATFATVRSTSVAVQQAQQQSLHDDARAYEALIAYAATHRSWGAADGVVARLARRTGERIVVTDTGGRTLVDSSGTSSAALHSPKLARATIDPLNVDTTLLPETPTLGDSVQEAQPVPCVAARQECRFVVTGTTSIDSRVSGPFDGDTARAARVRLEERIDRCLDRAGLAPAIVLNDDFSVVIGYGDHHATVARCIDDSRREMLSSYVAPRALLFVGDGRARADVLWDLSSGGWLRVLLLAGAVLGVTLVLCALLARQVVRPLRGMAHTALRASEGDLGARVDYRRADEVGEVAQAFNAMAERRQQLEVARRQLVSDVSHELRTPVSNARAWLEGAQDGLVETNDELLASLHEEMVHLQRLIEDLHEISLGDAGELRIQRERFDLRPLLEQVAASFGGAAEAAGVELVVDVSSDGWVDADPMRLRQALSNLVANALRHTPSGGRVELDGAPGRVSVTDTGEGIPPEELDRIFERFHRVDRSRSRTSGGSGLGLAIVRQIVEAHGGTTTARSRPGSGTTVVLTFPEE